MTDSQEKTKLGYECFNCFFDELKPHDYHSRMVLEILFKLLLEKKYEKTLSVSVEKE